MIFLGYIVQLLASGEVRDARIAMREQGQTPAEIERATERIVRHHLEPHVPPEEEWPERFRYPRCAYCDGTGLVLARSVENRLGCLVDEGTPCRCARGARFLKPLPTGSNFTDAAKTTKPKPKGFTRFSE